jgi:hypothetical protein
MNTPKSQYFVKCPYASYIASSVRVNSIGYLLCDHARANLARAFCPLSSSPIRENFDVVWGASGREAYYDLFSMLGASAHMQTITAINEYSIHFQAIERWFHSVEAPYRLQDILAFNALYQCFYSRLAITEKRRVEEEIVNALIDGVEDPKLKAKIFGVV